MSDLIVLDVFPWNANFETGIPEVDEQHKKLVHLLNVLASHLAFQSAAPKLEAVFQELAEYAQFHFVSEEAVWQPWLGGDASYASHARVHASFMDEVVRLKQAQAALPLEQVLENILSFLTHWLAFHILDEDMRMAKAVLALRDGYSLAEAKRMVDAQMTGAMSVLIKTILDMYDALSKRTLQLAREMAERQRAQEKLRLAANVVENTLDAICITDSSCRIIEANPSFYESTGLTADAVIGRLLHEVKTGLADEPVARVLPTLNQEYAHWSGQVANRLASGAVEYEWLTLSVVMEEEGVVRNYVAVFSNITHLIRHQRRLERIAHHDALTGLPNRLLLKDRLQQAVARAHRLHEHVTVGFIDLDGFKQVNDLLGHAAGDDLLKTVANRLQTCLRAHDTVARLGGDEFVLILTELKASQDAQPLMERALAELQLPIDLGGVPVRISASIGASGYPVHSQDVDELLSKADNAMYSAKRAGKAQILWAGDGP